MASLRDVFVRLGIKTDPKGANLATKQLDTIKQAAKTAIAALAGFATIKFAKSIADETRALGDRLDKVSQQVGVTTDALQELEFAGGLAGAASGDMSMALRMLSRNAREAATGAAEYADDFRAMGIQVTGANGQLKSADQLLMDVADGMTRLSTDTERTALAQTLLGRSGAKLIPLLKQGSSAIAAQRKEARELGLLNQEQIAQAVELTDNQLRLSRAWASIKFVVAEQLLPSINAFTTGLTRFLRANRRIIRSRVEAFFRRFGQVVDGVSSFVRRLADAFGPMGMQILKLTAGVLALVAALMLPGVPILLLIGLIALLIEDFETWRAGGDSVIGDLVGGFERLLAAVNEWRGSAAQAFGDVEAWLAEHRVALSLLTSAATAAAAVYALHWVRANRLAIRLFLNWHRVGLIIFKQQAAAAIASAAASAKAWVAAAAVQTAAAVKAGAAWVVATLPLVATAALLTIIIGTVIFLGRELYRLATGQENVFSTMKQGVSDLIGKYGGVAPAIEEMLEEATRFWLKFFGMTEDDAADFVDNMYQTLIKLWPNVLKFWSEKLGGWWKKWGNLVDLGFGAEPASQPGAPGPAPTPVPSVIAGPGATIPAPAAAGGGGVTDNRQTVYNTSVHASPGMDERELARVVVREIDRKTDRDYRSASQAIAVGAQ